MHAVISLERAFGSILAEGRRSKKQSPPRHFCWHNFFQFIFNSFQHSAKASVVSRILQTCTERSRGDCTLEPDIVHESAKSVQTYPKIPHFFVPVFVIKSWDVTFRGELHSKHPPSSGYLHTQKIKVVLFFFLFFGKSCCCVVLLLKQINFS